MRIGTGLQQALGLCCRATALAQKTRAGRRGTQTTANPCNDLTCQKRIFKL